MARNVTHEHELMAEPTLDEMLADPIVQLIMKRDGVKANDISGAMDVLQRRYANLAVAI